LAGRYSWFSVTDVLIFAANVLAAVALPLLVARGFGLRLARWRPDGTLDAGPPRSWRFQFSILYMFGLTTATALVLGTVKWVVAGSPLSDSMVDADVVHLALGLGVIAWAAMAAALRSRSAPWSMAGLATGAILMMAAAVITAGLLTGRDRRYLAANDNLGLLLLLDGAMVLVWLCVFRLAGYRLVFCWGGRIVNGTVRKDEAPRPRPVVAISLVCAHCHGPVSVPAEYRGQTGRCPLCGGTLTVPPAA
jgi:hypothetical protein